VSPMVEERKPGILKRTLKTKQQHGRRCNCQCPPHEPVGLRSACFQAPLHSRRPNRGSSGERWSRPDDVESANIRQKSLHMASLVRRDTVLRWCRYEVPHSASRCQRRGGVAARESCGAHGALVCLGDPGGVRRRRHGHVDVHLCRRMGRARRCHHFRLYDFELSIFHQSPKPKSPDRASVSG
jgi:hypothetical protein